MTRASTRDPAINKREKKNYTTNTAGARRRLPHFGTTTESDPLPVGPTCQPAVRTGLIVVVSFQYESKTVTRTRRASRGSIL